MHYISQSGQIEIALTGDCLISRSVLVFTEQRFLDLVALLRRADVAVTNLETTFHSYEHAPASVAGGTYMRAHPRIIEDLKWLGFRIVSAANNHQYDFGENGLIASLSNLEEAGVIVAGIGRNLSQAREPKYIDTPAGRVALISATSSGPAGLAAQHQWRDGQGRPGANMVRYTSRYTVDPPTFDALRTFNREFHLSDRMRRPQLGYLNTSWGQSAIEDSDSEFYMGDLHNLFQYPAPKGYRISRGDEFRVDLVPDEEDLEENLQRISDARRMADWVVVSFHNHEHGPTDHDPSAVATEFAHHAIDAGADVFHGHGPHHDRGIEIYRGKPILYSIGKFIYQTDTVERIERDNVLRQGLDPWQATPADFYDARSGQDTPDNAHTTTSETWRDFVAVVRLAKDGSGELRLHPIELGAGTSRGTRGRPVLASTDAAIQVVDHMRDLSEPFGTTVTMENGVGVITWMAGAR